jgi:hypothetical protein
MNYPPQRFIAPDGTPLVIITDAEYNRLLAAAGPAEQTKDDAGDSSDLKEWSPLFGEFGG